MKTKTNLKPARSFLRTKVKFHRPFAFARMKAVMEPPRYTATRYAKKGDDRENQNQRQGRYYRYLSRHVLPIFEAGMCSWLGAAPVRLFFGKIELLCADGCLAGDRNPKACHRIGLERLVIQPCRIAVHGQIRIHGGDAIRLFATDR